MDNLLVMQVASINRIPKPKPKIEKKPAKEVESADKEKTASETESPGTSQESKATEGEPASPETGDSEHESHDEL
jgi:hypoxia up-regulated 1